jgi:hypothetical protein
MDYALMDIFSKVETIKCETCQTQNGIRHKNLIILSAFTMRVIAAFMRHCQVVEYSSLRKRMNAEPTKFGSTVNEIASVSFRNLANEIHLRALVNYHEIERSIPKVTQRTVGRRGGQRCQDNRRTLQDVGYGRRLPLT